MKITRTLAKKVLKVVDAGLVSGVGNPIPGQMCVEAAVCFAMGLPHGDEPTCVNRAIRNLKIRLNASAWSSDQARAKGMRKLAILQLGTDINFNEQEFSEKVVVFLYTDIMPTVYRRRDGEALAVKSENCKSLIDCKNLRNEILEFKKAYAAAYDAADAAACAADAAADAAACAAYVVAYAAACAADDAAVVAYVVAYAAACDAACAADAADAARDQALTQFADGISNILIEMKVLGVKWLDLL